MNGEQITPRSLKGYIWYKRNLFELWLALHFEPTNKVLNIYDINDYIIVYMATFLIYSGTIFREMLTYMIIIFEM